jgi:starch phosphorylase
LKETAMSVNTNGTATWTNSRSGMTAEDIARGFAEHLKYGLVRDRYTATLHDRYLALAMAMRDRLIAQWIETQQRHHANNVKRVYYLSLEYLMGRAMGNNVINMKLEGPVRDAMSKFGLDWEEMRDEEVDAGLGNGGLGRLAACFLDSLASLQIPSMGYGIRYDYGIFTQRIENGHQVEEPDDWTRGGNPWEIERLDYRIPVHFGGRVEDHGGKRVWTHTIPVIGIPYDTPIVGYGGATVNTLRLWSAKGHEEFDFEDFNQGDYISAVESKVRAENLTKVLYPNDAFYIGKELRLRQQYFFVACSLHDIIRRFKTDNGENWDALPDKAAVQLNDTHPSIAVAELMRILIDEEDLSWDRAWPLTVATMGYTNHTLLPEALEKWPVEMFQKLLPRHLEIIYEINSQFLQEVARMHPGSMDRLGRMSLIEEGETKQIRMAHLAIVGSHSINGVSQIHTDLLKSRVVPDFAEMYPDRFHAITNGITPRRWLLKANPPLAALITEAIGDTWPSELSELEKLKPLADDAAFCERVGQVKRQAKETLAAYAKKEYGFTLNPEMIFDVQVKRLHEYKRQFLNAIHIVMLYNRIRRGEGDGVPPRTFLFGAKAAPAYTTAKIIIKLINNLGAVINNDPAVNDKLQVHFLPNYRVSAAEKIIPGAEVSEQISLAGTEASGTGNMKFMLNGALTLGTLDGANVEMREEMGSDNIYIFGMTAEEAAERKQNYNAREIYENDPEIKEALDMIFGGHFSINESGIFEPLRETTFDRNDYFMVLADLRAYADAQADVGAQYLDPAVWNRKATLNIAASGKFSSDRTIRDYCDLAWNASPHEIPVDERLSSAFDEAAVVQKS